MLNNITLAFPRGSDGKESACNAGDQGPSLDQEDPLEKGMETHSSILSWRIPWTEEPGRLHPWDLKQLDTTERLTRSLTFNITLSVYTTFCLSIHP